MTTRLFFIAFILCYSGTISFLRASDTGDGKRKNIAGWLACGFVWPWYRDQADRNLSEGEKRRWVFVIILIVVVFFSAFI